LTGGQKQLLDDRSGGRTTGNVIMATSGARTAQNAIAFNYIKLTIFPQHEKIVAIILIK
jgi:hypothetical protein